MWAYNYNNTYELYHHGVKGMKWGVRRYQNKDGSLTPAGKKRYYNESGWLTDEGHRQRDKNSYKIYEGSKKVRKKLEKDKEYNDAVNEIKKTTEASRKFYQKSHDSFLNGTDFKNMDFYQFKDEMRNRWANTAEGKARAKSEKELRAVIDKKVRKILGDKMFNQKLPELNSSSWTSTLGKDYVDRIFNITRTLN